jgi:ferredoxin-NADP reductase
METTKIFFTGRKEICEDTYSFTFNLYDSDYNFKPGQYAHFTIMDPVLHDANGNSRPLSFANSPDHINSLMVAARRNQSVFVENLLSLTPGSELQVSEPEGDVFLHKDETAENVFIAGGIGITPVRSIVEFATENDLKNKITLFYSNKSLSQAPFMNELLEWSAENENFRFIPFFDVEEKIKELKYETGRIDLEKLIKHLKNFENKKFFLIGPPAMVDSIKDLLLIKNVSEENIKTERFI